MLGLYVAKHPLPWVLQHACFTINRYLVHADGMTNYQRWRGLQYTAAICNPGEIVLADIKPVTSNKLAIRNNEPKIEGIRHGKTTNSGEHIIATKENNGKISQTRSLTRMTPDQQWNKTIFDNINIPLMDTTMNAKHDSHRSSKQPGHRRWIKNKEVQQPPDLDNAGGQQEHQTSEQDTIQPPPSLQTIMKDILVRPWWCQYEDDIAVL
eukprot:6028370-Amphidinium_carterae.3